MTGLMVHVDAPPVRRSEAVKLMVHHLELAAMYFEATPDTTVDALAEINVAFSNNPMAQSAARSWYTILVNEYVRLDG